MKRRSFFQKLYNVVSVSVLFCLAVRVFAIDRKLEPVVMNGANFSQFTGAVVEQGKSELFLYAYDAGNDTWSQIPFQFDERNANGEYGNPSGDETAGLDDNDELSFMAADLGDEAPGSWIDDLVSMGNFRYVIVVEDPLTGQKGWAYLYRSTTIALDATLTEYVTYYQSTGNNIAEDRVETSYYHIANATGGFPKDITILSSQGGNDKDLLDIMKFRATADIGLNVDIDENDIEYNEPEDYVRVKAGLIRVIRELHLTIVANLPWPLPDQDIPFTVPPAFYYPYSAIINIEVPSVSGASISDGRLSFDLNTDAIGMTFMSANNPDPGFLVNGVDDAPNTFIDDLLPLGNWSTITGTPGVIVHMFPVAQTVGGNRNLYYEDDVGNGSFGDTGVEITNGIDTPFEISYKGYFLGTGQPADIGSQIAQFEANPFLTTSEAQDFGSVPVELVAFNTDVQGNDIILTWTTATETDNFGFEIENKEKTEQEWRKIGFLAGQGTTIEPVQYRFTHSGLSSGIYAYRLKQIDLDGAFTYSEILTAAIASPQTFVLQQNFPNPFNPTTVIQYQIPGASVTGGGPLKTNVTVYNILGHKIRQLVDSIQPAGFYSVTWNGTDEMGRFVPAGVYIYRIQAGPYTSAKKMILVK